MWKTLCSSDIVCIRGAALGVVEKWASVEGKQGWQTGTSKKPNLLFWHLLTTEEFRWCNKELDVWLKVLFSWLPSLELLVLAGNATHNTFLWVKLKCELCRPSLQLLCEPRCFLLCHSSTSGSGEAFDPGHFHLWPQKCLPAVERWDVVRDDACLWQKPWGCAGDGLGSPSTIESKCLFYWTCQFCSDEESESVAGQQNFKS